MKLRDVMKVLDGLAPLRYAESWDNVGLLVGDRNADITRIVVTVDYSGAVAEEAILAGAQLVVAYHPPMFAAVKRVPHEALWADAVRRGIALYSMHTALDVVNDGTNTFLAQVCGVTVMTPIRPFANRLPIDPEGIGLGRIGDIAPRKLGDIITDLKSALGLAQVLVAGKVDAEITRVAVAAGAGGELLSDAVRQGADLFVTGELRHHDATRTNVIATLHSNSERKAVSLFADRLRAALQDVDVAMSQRDADPFHFV
jgi:dinuclear metal center YbgI/SA1388 family protein